MLNNYQQSEKSTTKIYKKTEPWNDKWKKTEEYRNLEES